MEEIRNKKCEELILPHSKRLCFFCLKDLSPITIKIKQDNEKTTTPTIQYSNESHQFSLRHLSRYLNFNEEAKEKDVVETCGDCFKLTEEFTEIYKALDLIQLRMNWCLRKILQVMKNERDKLDEGEQTNSMTRNKFADLRRWTIQNSDQRIHQTSFPFVAVKRLAFKDLTASQPQSHNSSSSIHGQVKVKVELLYSCDEDQDPSSPSPSPYYFIEEECSSDPLSFYNDNENNESESNHPTSAPVAQNHIPSDYQNHPPTLPENNANNNNDILYCPYCRASFRGKTLSLLSKQNFLSAHIIQYHCEHYFPSGKLDAVTDFQYQQIFIDLLFQDYCTVTTMGKFNCSFCDATFSAGIKDNFYAHLARFKLHLLNDHRQELEAKLMAIQEDPELSENLNTVNPEGKRCDCGVYLPTPKALDRHRLYHCNNAVPKKHSMRKQGSNKDLQIVKRRKATKQNGVNVPTMSAKRIRFVNPKNESSFKIPSGSNFPRENGRTSLDSDHEESESVQVQSHHISPFDERYNQSLPSSSFSSSLVNKNKNHYSCPNCRAIFSFNERTMTIQQMRLKGHLLEYHGEQYFPNQKLDTTTRVQYKRILVDLLFRDCCMEKEKRNNYNCPYCTRSFDYGNGNSDNLVNFKLHILNEHRRELEEKLLEIQQDPGTLSEKLDACNLEGVSCDCGVYLPCQSSYRIHRVHHCTEKNSREVAILPNDNYLNVDNREQPPPPPQAGNTCSIVDESSSASASSFIRNISPLECPQMKKDSSTFLDRNSISCPYCRATFISKESLTSTQENRLSAHILQYHCAHYFPLPANKLDKVTDLQYQKILVYLLFEGTSTSSSAEESNRLCCEWCPVSFNSRDSQPRRKLGLKLHMLNEHKRELEGKLLQLQRDPKLSERLRTCNIEGMRCECGVYLQSIANHSVHLRHHCILQQREEAVTPSKDGIIAGNTSKRPTSQTQDEGDRDQTSEKCDVCPYCKMKVATCAGGAGKELRRHMLRFHLDHFFPNARNHALVTEEQFKMALGDLLFPDLERGNKCRLCTKQFGKSSAAQKSVYIKDHYIKKHYKFLLETLNTIQENPSLKEELSSRYPNGVICSCGAYLRSKTSKAFHRKFSECETTTCALNVIP